MAAPRRLTCTAPPPRAELKVMMKALLVLHAVVAIVVVGSATHGGVLAIKSLFDRPSRPRLQRTYATVTALSYLACYGLGLVIYPTFRVNVRAAYFDVELPMATGVFEVKEHWLGLGLVALAAFWPLSRILDLRTPSPEARTFFVLAILMAGLVWYGTLAGLGLVALRPL